MTRETAALRGPLRKRDSHLWARDPDDWYVEPEWCSERLFAVEKFEGRVWDPACGMGRIPFAARAAGYHAMGTDLVQRTEHFPSQDFFTTSCKIENIVSNPPFGRAEEFAEKALRSATYKIALLLPANWVQGDKRSRWLETTPLARVYFITPRPSMPPGAVVKAGGKPGNGTTDYAWFVWNHERGNPHCRPMIAWLRRE